MRESRTYGSVRGALSNERPYRDRFTETQIAGHTRMRDLNTLLNSLVNIDRKSLIALLMSEAEKAEHQVQFSRHRTGAQREKHRAVIELLARIRQILSFLQDGQTAPEMIDSDIVLCKSLEEKLRAKGSW
jgi:hypothetical protein